MIEDDLKATFARHEAEAPDVGALRRGIERLWRRRRRHRLALRASSVAVVAALAVATVPTVARLAGVSGPDGIIGASTAAGPLNVLVIGLDPGPENYRADTVMMLHVPADRSRAYLVSFERDLVVDLPGHGRNKLNQSYPVGGATLTASIVESITGVRIDGTVTVSLDALRRVTDTLGGVPVCLPEAISSIHTGRTYPAGCRSLDGATVVDVVRQRRDLPTGSYGRDRTAQRVMVGLAARAASLNLLLDADKLVSLSRTPGLAIDLDGVSVVELARQVRGIDPADVVGLSQPTFRYVDANGWIGEELDPVVGPQLFQALRDERLDQFAVAHPDWVLSP